MLPIESQVVAHVMLHKAKVKPAFFDSRIAMFDRLKLVQDAIIAGLYFSCPCLDMLADHFCYLPTSQASFAHISQIPRRIDQGGDLVGDLTDDAGKGIVQLTCPTHCDRQGAPLMPYFPPHVTDAIIRSTESSGTSSVLSNRIVPSSCSISTTLKVRITLILSRPFS